tara:strand:+ start:210 stop:452 length:243 start_codon:yes stop_codon:yes gene_type:complete
MKQLNSDQKEALISQFVEIVVDNMDTKDLVRYAIDQLETFYDDSHLDFIKDEVESYQEGLFDELVDNVIYNESFNQGGKF